MIHSRVRAHERHRAIARSLKASFVVLGVIFFAACSRVGTNSVERTTASASAEPSYRRLDPIDVWPGVAPGSENWNYEEIWDESSGSVRNVVRPTLTPYLPTPESATGTAVIIAPGGAFLVLSIEHEGHEPAKWFAERGIAAFVLKYRTVETPTDRAALMKMLGEVLNGESSSGADGDNSIGVRALLAAADAQQALAVLRSRAAEWGYSADRVGLMGFSAGGYIATHLLAQEDTKNRPNFVVPIYGGMIDPKADVPKDLPPIFAVAAADDPLSGGLVDMIHRLYAAGHRPAFHLYDSGGHGFGLRRQGKAVDRWIDELDWWMSDHGFLNRR